MSTATTFQPYRWSTWPNRYDGVCHGCTEQVAAGDGFYEAGMVFCSQPGQVGDRMWVCADMARTGVTA